jgi:DNA invertase Pin-like site-specific DNA recombinase
MAEKIFRCAVYTRKSTEDGLEQEFNSLDAQYEACAAYALSQRHEGWVLVKERYDDGGFSGGNMERPGLKRLLADVEAGRIDIILLYKIDRLTRSLTDFSRIVDVLDRAKASFVSITQSFNTTTSMGRLTLNMLLSFAQFEREVTGERIRDKIAASKRKGLWMGGPVPLGYEVKDRKLLVKPSRSATSCAGTWPSAVCRRWRRNWSARDTAPRSSAAPAVRTRADVSTAAVRSTTCSPTASIAA